MAQQLVLDGRNAQAPNRQALEHGQHSAVAAQTGVAQRGGQQRAQRGVQRLLRLPAAPTGALSPMVQAAQQPLAAAGASGSGIAGEAAERARLARPAEGGGKLGMAHAVCWCQQPHMAGRRAGHARAVAQLPEAGAQQQRDGRAEAEPALQLRGQLPASRMRLQGRRRRQQLLRASESSPQGTGAPPEQGACLVWLYSGFRLHVDTGWSGSQVQGQATTHAAGAQPACLTSIDAGPAGGNLGRVGAPEGGIELPARRRQGEQRAPTSSVPAARSTAQHSTAQHSTAQRVEAHHRQMRYCCSQLRANWVVKDRGALPAAGCSACEMTSPMRLRQPQHGVRGPGVRCVSCGSLHASPRSWALQSQLQLAAC